MGTKPVDMKEQRYVTYIKFKINSVIIDMYTYNERIKICMEMIYTNLILILVVSSEQGEKDEDIKTFSCFFKQLFT